VARVARSFGPSFEAVWRQRYDLTLLAHLSLLDLERLDGLVRRHEQLGTSVDISLGVSKGSLLQREVDAFERSLHRGPRADEQPQGFDISPYLGFPGMPHYKKPVS